MSNGCCTPDPGGRDAAGPAIRPDAGMVAPAAPAIRSVARHAVPLALVGAAFVHALATSWRKWGNLLVDGGRELELPHRLLEGGRLYETVRHLYGPLPAWINAGLYAAFGVHLDVLVAAGIVTAAGTTLVLYALALRFAGRWTAAALAAWFVYVSAFGHLVPNPSFNFVIPYTYAATYGIAAAATSLLFAVRHLQLGRDVDLGVSLVFASAAVLCKIEPALAIASAHTVLLVGGAAAGLLTRRRLALYAAALGLVAAVYGALTLRVGSRLWSDNILFAANRSIAVYARATMGLDDVAGSLRALFISAALMGAAILAGWASARIASGSGRRRHALAAVVAIAGAALLLAAGTRTSIDLSLRALPLLGLCAFAALAVAFVRGGSRRSVPLAHLVLWAFALACLSRLLLRAVPYHYGFYLTPIPVLAAATVLTGRASPAAGLRPWPRASSLPGLGLLAGIALACFLTSRQLYDLHRVSVESARGSLLLLPGDVVPEGLQLLSTLPADAKVISVPTGTGLVFLSGRRWGDAAFTYFPPEVVGGGGDDDASLVRRWSADPPDAVLYIAADMREFGYVGFGVDYGRRALGWLQENYVASSDPQSRVVLLRRRSPR